MTVHTDEGVPAGVKAHDFPVGDQITVLRHRLLGAVIRKDPGHSRLRRGVEAAYIGVVALSPVNAVGNGRSKSDGGKLRFLAPGVFHR